MSQIFNQNGKVIPVTLIKAGPCWVTQVKTEDQDSYSSVQIGFEPAKSKHVNKAQQGHFKKAGLKRNYRYLREFSAQELKLGHKIKVDIFNPGEIVKIIGISKGKGFQGVVKRHGFSGANATHGTKHNERAPGSIGSAFPQRVFKGKRMAGRMGNDRITVKGLEIVEVDKDENILAIKGAVPGKIGTLLEIITTKEIESVKEDEQKQLEEMTKKKKEKKEEKKQEVKEDKEQDKE